VSITQIESGVDKTPGQNLTWDLYGLDPACRTGSGNQCGIHIHEGSSCDHDARGHYWEKTKVSEDPWTALQYDADDEGVSKVQNATKIMTGIADVMGKVVIVLDSTALGRRIACALIVEETRVEIGSTVVAKTWNKAFNSGNYYEVTGWVSIKQIESGNNKTPGQELTWHLHDVDSSCMSGNQWGCGIHIHEATSCDEDPKGHYWEKTKVIDDPWTSLQYVADSYTGVSKVTNATTIVTGTADILGKAIIVHNSGIPGVGIACALIEEGPKTPDVKVGHTVVANIWKKYVNSDTNFTVYGSVSITQIESGVDKTPGQNLTWDLWGLDPACRTGSGNQCGIHIYEGTSCDEDAKGHYWEKTKVTDDPWTALQYDADDAGVSKVMNATTIVTGTADILGKAVIVHDSINPGRRIACALIVTPDPPEFGDMSGAILQIGCFGMFIIILSVRLLLIGQRM